MLTGDTLLGGRLTLCQPTDGYRFSIDAVLLAGFCRPGAEWRVIDLGTGCGVIALLLAFRHRTLRVCGVELQPDLAAMAAGNVLDNRMQERVQIVAARMQDFRGAHDFCLPVDLVVSNPPYRVAHSGRVNPEPQRAAARHEIHVNLMEVVACAARMLRHGGRFATIYPSERLGGLMATMQREGVEPKRVRMVHPRPGQGAGRVLAEGVKGARAGLAVEPPLYIAGGRTGRYSDEVIAMLDG